MSSPANLAKDGCLQKRLLSLGIGVVPAGLFGLTAFLLGHTVMSHRFASGRENPRNHSTMVPVLTAAVAEASGGGSDRHGLVVGYAGLWLCTSWN